MRPSLSYSSVVKMSKYSVREIFPTQMKGRLVSVELTDLKEAISDCENFAHCWMDGIIEDDIKSGIVRIRLKQGVGRTFELPSDSPRIQDARESTTGHFWSKGDEVHVRETNGGKIGWWAATIESKPKFGDTQCKVRWKGDYTAHDAVSIVNFTDLRLAHPVNDDTSGDKELEEEEEEESAQIIKRERMVAPKEKGGTKKKK